MITMAAPARNIRLIAETITTSYTGIVYHFEYRAIALLFQCRLLISVECARVEHYP